MKIQKKILAILLTMALLSHLVVTAVYFVYSQQKVSEQAINHLSSLAKMQYQRLEFFIQANRENLRLIQSRTQMRHSLLHYQYTKDQRSLDMIEQILDDAIAQASSLEDIFVLGLDGNVIYSTSGLYQGASFKHHALFIQGSKEVFVSLLYDDKKGSSPPLLFSAPLYYNGKFLGVVGIQVNMDDFYQHLTNYTGLGKTGEVLLATSRPDNTLLFFTPLRFSSFPLLLSGEADSAYPMKMALDAGMVVKMDRNEVLAYGNNLQSIFLFLVVLLIVVTVIVSIRLAKRITTPVLQLTDAALLISKGQYHQRASTRSKDELGNLGKAINTMADELLGAKASLEEQIKIKTQELVAANKQLEELAQTDSLTGLKSRRFFDTQLEREWSRCKRHRCEVSLLMVDIDFFKHVNDNIGHQIGDRYLKTVAETLAQVVGRKEDTIARYGGEELVVLITDISHEKAIQLAERIRTSIEDIQLIAGCTDVSQYLTVSIGVYTTVPKYQQSEIQLVEQADHALYAAKATGRNRVKSWNTMVEKQSIESG